MRFPFLNFLLRTTTITVHCISIRTFLHFCVIIKFLVLFLASFIAVNRFIHPSSSSCPVLEFKHEPAVKGDLRRMRNKVICVPSLSGILCYSDKHSLTIFHHERCIAVILEEVHTERDKMSATLVSRNCRTFCPSLYSGHGVIINFEIIKSWGNLML